MLDRFFTVTMFLFCALAGIMSCLMAAEGDLWSAGTAFLFSLVFFGFGLYFGAESEK